MGLAGQTKESKGKLEVEKISTLKYRKKNRLKKYTQSGAWDTQGAL